MIVLVDETHLRELGRTVEAVELAGSPFLRRPVSFAARLKELAGREHRQTRQRYQNLSKAGLSQLILPTEPQLGGWGEKTVTVPVAWSFVLVTGDRDLKKTLEHLTLHSPTGQMAGEKGTHPNGDQKPMELY